MTNTAIAILGLAALHLLLTGLIVAVRVSVALSKGRPANSFTTTGEDISPFAQRLARAHANVFENAPYLLAILLVAMLTGHGAVTDGLALIVLGARVLQSLTHLCSVSAIAVQARFAFFMVQWGIAVYWIYAIWKVSVL